MATERRGLMHEFSTRRYRAVLAAGEPEADQMSVELKVSGTMAPVRALDVVKMLRDDADEIEKLALARPASPAKKKG